MALARNDSAGTKVDACDLCDHMSIQQITDPDESRERAVKSMHTPCSDCLSFDDRDQNLCSICQHWRFRHFFNCVPETLDRFFSIRKMREYRLSKGCAFCDMIHHALKIGAKSWGKDPSLISDRYPLLRFLFINNGQIGYSHPSGDGSVHLYNPADVPECVRTETQWGLVKDWLTECTREHDICRCQYFEQPVGMRLIDVQKERLVRAKENSRFVALSYVWGSNPNPNSLICTSQNVEDLEQDGGIRSGRLPRTIDDAIRICKILGEDYLWVDRLCIIQDDSSQKHQQIEAMARIFSSASLVIVVLDGDMETGIPGVQPRTFEIQKQTEGAGLVYTNELPRFDRLINNSYWNTRGWTYQEAILARRRLYFSWAQVVFQCNTHFREEDAVARRNHLFSPGKSLMDMEWSLNTWQEHLSTYTARSLRYQSDIYNAIAGIANALLPEPTSWLYGLPRRDFDEALLWFNDLGHGYRISDSDKVLLPRWSWSSAKGQIKHLTLHGTKGQSWADLYQHTFVGTIVAWNYQDEDCGSRRFVPVRDSKSVAYVGPRNHRSCLVYSRKDPSIHRDNCMTFASERTSSLQRMYTSVSWESSPRLLCFGIAWSQGLFDAEWPFPALDERTFQELGADLEEKWQEVDYLERDIVLSLPHGQQISIPEIEMSLDRSTLKGRAQTSFFALKENSTESRSAEFFTIIDCDARPAGQIYKTKKEKANASIQCSASCTYQLIALAIGLFHSTDDIQKVHGNFLSEDPVAGHLWDSILLDENETLPKTEFTQEEINGFCEAVGPNGLDISYLDSEGSALRFIPIVHVMLAEWDGPVARRISIGWIFLTRWVKSNPQLKTVYLA